MAWITAPFSRLCTRRLALEQAVQQHLGTRSDVLAYGSARGAIAACLRAAGIGPGDKVLLSSYTCLAVPTAVIAIGACPVYLDIDLLRLYATAEQVIDAMESDVRAVIVQHTLGCIAETELIVAEARQRGVLVIEDCALSIGSTRQGQPVGTFGDAAVFSMELSTAISSGWGGVLVVNNPLLAHRVIEDYALVPEPGLWKTAHRIWQTMLSGICYEPLFFPIGRYVMAAAFRYGLFKLSTPPEEVEGRPCADFIERLSGSQAVLATAQWQRLEAVAAICQQNGAWLRGAIAKAGLCVLAMPVQGDIAVTPRVSFVVANREKCLRWFAEQEIEMGLWFNGPLSPLPEQSIFNYDKACYPKAELVAHHVVNLACHCRLKIADLERMASLLSRYVHAHPEEQVFITQFPDQITSAIVERQECWMDN